MARNFKKREYDAMEKPVIIAVSSCKVSLYGRTYTSKTFIPSLLLTYTYAMSSTYIYLYFLLSLFLTTTLQLFGTPATYYYLNPDIPDLEEYRSQYKAEQELNPPLKISKERCQDLSQEKIRNRDPLSTLMQQNPDTYRSVRFTCDGTIVGVNTTRDWYYESCTRCTGKVIDGDDIPQCLDHGPQPNRVYRYIFKVAISDGTTTAQFTFFTPNADVLTKADCTELVKLYDTPSPRDFPPEILNLKGRNHIFQFHYNSSCEKGNIDFYFNDILDKPLQITSRSEQEREVPGSKLIASGSKPPQLLSKEPSQVETEESPDTPSQLTTCDVTMTTPSITEIGLSQRGKQNPSQKKQVQNPPTTRQVTNQHQKGSHPKKHQSVRFSKMTLMDKRRKKTD